MAASKLATTKQSQKQDKEIGEAGLWTFGWTGDKHVVWRHHSLFVVRGGLRPYRLGIQNPFAKRAQVGALAGRNGWKTTMVGILGKWVLFIGTRGQEVTGFGRKKREERWGRDVERSSHYHCWLAHAHLLRSFIQNSGLKSVHNLGNR